MVTIEIINYIKGQLAEGKSQEEIKETLVSRGWTEPDIIQAFGQSSTNQSTATQSSVTKTIEQPISQTVNPSPLTVPTSSGKKPRRIWIKILIGFGLIVVIGISIFIFGIWNILHKVKVTRYTTPPTTQSTADALAGKYETSIESFMQNLANHQDATAYTQLSDEAKAATPLEKFTQAVDSIPGMRTQPFHLTTMTPIEVQLNGQTLQEMRIDGYLGNNSDNAQKLKFQFVERANGLQIIYFASTGTQTTIYKSQ